MKNILAAQIYTFIRKIDRNPYETNRVTLVQVRSKSCLHNTRCEHWFCVKYGFIAINYKLFNEDNARVQSPEVVEAFKCK